MIDNHYLNSLTPLFYSELLSIMECLPSILTRFGSPPLVVSWKYMKSLGQDFSNYTETAKGLNIVEVQKSLNSDCDYSNFGSHCSGHVVSADLDMHS